MVFTKDQIDFTLGLVFLSILAGFFLITAAVTVFNKNFISVISNSGR